MSLLRSWHAGWILGSLITLISIGGSGIAHAEPVDLQDRTPRDVVVRFEMSPRSTPDALDVMYSEVLPARLEPGPAGQLYIVIEGRYVAEHLFASESATPNSFGDFVWTFDSETGDVLGARVEGEIVQSIDWGFGITATRARIDVHMSTREAAGFREGQRVFGNQVFRHCDPNDSGWSACHQVEAVRFDRETGYVNAVGVINVNTPVGIGATSFSPLGEAIFLESDLPAVSSAGTIVAAGSPSEMAGPVE